VSLTREKRKKFEVREAKFESKNKKTKGKGE